MKVITLVDFLDLENCKQLKNVVVMIERGADA